MLAHPIAAMNNLHDEVKAATIAETNTFHRLLVAASQKYG